MASGIKSVCYETSLVRLLIKGKSVLVMSAIMKIARNNLKLRQAKKICLIVFEEYKCSRPFRFCESSKWKCNTVEKAIVVCRSKKAPRHREMPYIPTEEEMNERAEIGAYIFCDIAEILGVPTEEVDKIREQIWK
jgi:hypothetical protein